MKNSTLKQILAGSLGLLLTMSPFFLFAEPAPVYDADALPSQFDSPDQPQADDLPPPPPDQDNAFVPMQQRHAQTQMLNPPPGQTIAQNQTMGPRPAPGQNQSSVEERLERIEQQIYTMQDNTQSSDSSPRIDFLLSQVQALRAQVEQLTRQMQMQQQAKAPETTVPLSANNLPAEKPAMETPVTAPEKNPKLVSNPTKPLTVVSTKTQAQPNVAEEQQIYQTAYNLIKLKKYSEAVNTLQSMLKRYPSGQFASNAHYWLGELYGVMGKNDQALSEFNTVVKSYPDSPRVSDAQLKVGLIYATQFKWHEAKLAFKTVINRYPGTTSSRLAAEQIKQIKQAGH